MATKTIFLVLLSAALVLGYPTIDEQIYEIQSEIDEHDALYVDQLEDRFFLTVWKKVRNIFSNVLENLQNKLKKIEEKGKELLISNLSGVSRENVILLFQIKDLVTDVLVEGRKYVSPEVDTIVRSLEGLIEKLEECGSKALSNGNLVVDEILKKINLLMKEIVKVDVKTKIEIRPKNTFNNYSKVKGRSVN